MENTEADALNSDLVLPGPFDADNHYYEAPDAVQHSHVPPDRPPSPRSRADASGRESTASRARRRGPKVQPLHPEPAGSIPSRARSCLDDYSAAKSPGPTTLAPGVRPRLEPIARPYRPTPEAARRAHGRAQGRRRPCFPVSRRPRCRRGWRESPLLSQRPVDAPATPRFHRRFKSGCFDD